jgi:foldase protein PrsA
MNRNKEKVYRVVVGLLVAALIGLGALWAVEDRRTEGAAPPGADDCEGECREPSGDDAADGPPAEDDDLQAFRPIATIGDRSITLGELYRYAGEQHGREILKQMITEIVIDLEAERLGIEVGASEIEQELRNMQQGYESEEEFYRVMLEQLGMDRKSLERDIRYTLLLEKIALHDVVITDEEFQQYLAEHPEQMMAGVRLHIQQIIVPTEEEAEEVRELLAQGRAFEELAVAYSDDVLFPDGDLGWLEWDDPFVPAEIMAQARRMTPGDVSPILELADGTFAIIKLQGREEPSAEERALRMEALRKQLQLSRAPNLQDLLVQLRIKYGVSVIDPDFR